MQSLLIAAPPIGISVVKNTPAGDQRGQPAQAVLHAHNTGHVAAATGLAEQHLDLRAVWCCHAGGAVAAHVWPFCDGRLRGR